MAPDGGLAGSCCDNQRMSLPPTFDPSRALSLARETLDIEAQAVAAMALRLDRRFVTALELVLKSRGRVVVMGMSKSGESEELTAILPLIKRMGVPLLAITGRGDSTLGRHADVVLDASVEKEACPHNLAPTASTTAQLAMGDALAVALLDARGFKADDFARSHPGGALGRKLLTHVSDVMRSGDAVPRVSREAGLMDLMREISAKGLGMSAIVDADNRVLGIFTDGDLRRLIEKSGSSVDLRALTASEVMHPNPRPVRADALAVEAADLMESNPLTTLLVVDDAGSLTGALNSNDLMRAKVI